MSATTGPAATPREVANEITRAWLAYFAVVTIAGIVLSLLVGGVFQFLVRFMAGEPWMMRIAIMAVSIAVNAPVSFVVFQWAVRGKVVPATLAWAVSGAAPAPEDSR
jgi:hypothetical protein